MGHPGGGVEPEDPTVVHALHREVYEELGAKITDVVPCFVDTVEHIGEDEGSTGVKVQHFFVCRLESMDPSLRHGPEVEEPAGEYEIVRVPFTRVGIASVHLVPLSLRHYLDGNIEGACVRCTPPTWADPGLDGMAKTTYASAETGGRRPLRSDSLTCVPTPSLDSLPIRRLTLRDLTACADLSEDRGGPGRSTSGVFFSRPDEATASTPPTVVWRPPASSPSTGPVSGPPSRPWAWCSSRSATPVRASDAG